MFLCFAGKRERTGISHVPLLFFLKSKVGMEESRSSSILERRASAVEFLFVLFNYLKGF